MSRETSALEFTNNPDRQRMKFGWSDHWRLRFVQECIFKGKDSHLLLEVGFFLYIESMNCGCFARKPEVARSVSVVPIDSTVGSPGLYMAVKNMLLYEFCLFCSVTFEKETFWVTSLLELSVRTNWHPAGLYWLLGEATAS